MYSYTYSDSGSSDDDGDVPPNQISYRSRNDNTLVPIEMIPKLLDSLQTRNENILHYFVTVNSFMLKWFLEFSAYGDHSLIDPSHYGFDSTQRDSLLFCIRDTRNFLVRPNIDGETPLHFAADISSPDILRFLMNFCEKKDLNLPSLKWKTPLHHLINNKSLNYDILFEFIKKGADVNSTGEHTEEQLQFLEQHIGRININPADNPRLTPIAYFIQNKSKDYLILKILLERGANPNIADAFGDTALHLYAKISEPDDNLTIPKMLVSHGACLHMSNWLNETALFYSVCKGNVNLSEFLLRYRADPNHETITGSTCLHEAVRLHNHKLITMLLLSGADINKSTVDGKKPTDMALTKNVCTNCFYKVATILIHHLHVLYYAKRYINSHDFSRMQLPHILNLEAVATCTQELNRLREDRLGDTGLTMLNIVQMNNVSGYCFNEKLINVLNVRRAEDLQQQYNLFHLIIRENIYMLMLHKKFWGVYHKSSNIFKEIPITCIDTLLRCLSRKDLFAFMEALTPEKERKNV